MIKVKQVSHSIGKTEILTDVSVDIPSGRLTTLIGPNGAGKSTLLSLIARLERLQTGGTKVGSYDVGTTSNAELARHLSILPQTMDATLRITVRELVLFGRYPYHHGRPTAHDHDHVARALDVFDLGPLADRSLDALSGGQRQRALVAMTFAQDTEYMLLDEPLNNLDIAGGQSLMRHLRTLVEDHGRTVVIVLHDINYAARYADWVIAMKDGKVVREGPPNDTIDKGLLRSVFGSEADVVTVDGKPLVLV